MRTTWRGRSGWCRSSTDPTRGRQPGVALLKPRLDDALLRRDQVDLEHERRIRRDHAAGATGTVAEFGGNRQHAGAAGGHALHAFIPALDDHALVEAEHEGLAAILAGVELLAAAIGGG